jgi:hypothetical protein
MKAVKSSFSKKANLPPAAYQARRVFAAYERASVSKSVRDVWVRTGFNYNERDGVFYLDVDEPWIGEFAKFREIWDIDFLEQPLTHRRRKQEWKWINKWFFPMKFHRKIEGKINGDESSVESD